MADNSIVEKAVARAAAGGDESEPDLEGSPPKKTIRRSSRRQGAQTAIRDDSDMEEMEGPTAKKKKAVATTTKGGTPKKGTKKKTASKKKGPAKNKATRKKKPAQTMVLSTDEDEEADDQPIAERYPSSGPTTSSKKKAPAAPSASKLRTRKKQTATANLLAGVDLNTGEAMAPKRKVRIGDKRDAPEPSTADDFNIEELLAALQRKQKQQVAEAKQMEADRDVRAAERRRANPPIGGAQVPQRDALAQPEADEVDYAEAELIDHDMVEMDAQAVPVERGPFANPAIGQQAFQQAFRQGNPLPHRAYVHALISCPGWRPVPVPVTAPSQ